jgi:arylsulfatase A-like enzyme
MRLPPAPARFLVAGALLAAIEVGLVLATKAALFLSLYELGRYALLAFSALPALCAALGVIAALAWSALVLDAGEMRARASKLRRSVWAFATPACAWALWALTAGRRVHALPGRLLWVALAAAAAAWAIASLAALLVRAHAGSPRRGVHAAWLLAGSALALALDMHVLARLYPAFHTSLRVLALAGALCAAPFLTLPRLEHMPRRWLFWPLAVALGALAMGSAQSLADAPNARFAIVESAPLSGRLLPRASVPRVTRAKAAAAPPARTATQLGIDLRGRDVLLISVDALRADRLRAYGGSGVTPAIDALADESVVFDHAYTPTPHTSYALSSLMTGKFMQPLLSLAETTDDHPTLPQMLRNHGYRTAAFYPPAIFFVDGERFEWLRKEQLGFEYVKAMYAPAAERVPQLEQYLHEVAPGHPLFVWIHLFEPHEPYDPLPEFAHGDTPVERYDGEVRAADAAVGKLVTAFRRARPSAVVILTADHGEEFGDHGGHHHGTTLFEEQVRVPLLWSVPDRAPAHHVSAAVEIIDITTTLLSALGVPREARMRGDDLGPWLAGHDQESTLRAFSSIEGARMWSDGRLKLICGEDECRMFDLAADPHERADIAQARADDAERLRAELDAFVASIPRLEALAMQGGGAWPAALARARLGDASAAPELVPLLSATRADVRAAAARALGELGANGALNVLSTLRERDTDAGVRAEAAIAVLRLGADEAIDQVAALLPAAGTAPDERARRAALALAARGDKTGEAVLLATALSPALDEPLRIAALRALGTTGGKFASQGLLPLLDEVRLRSEVAAALGAIGDSGAVAALTRALEQERYPEARHAEAAALIALGERDRALAGVRRFLGTASGVPGGVGLLSDAGAAALARAGGAELQAASALRRGEWQCETRGCRPLSGATLLLPRSAPRGSAQCVLRVQVEGTARRLEVDARVHYLNAGPNELSLALEHARGSKLALSADEGVWLVAFAAVPSSEDVPPPAPEPWSAPATGTPSLERLAPALPP